MSTTTRLVVTNIEASQGQKEVTANDAFAAFDKAIAGRLSQAITSADVTLSDDDARNAIIALTGTLTGNRALIVPTRTKLYLIHNSTGGAFTVTVKTSGGSGVVVPQGGKMIVFCDGTNVVAGLVVGTTYTQTYSTADRTHANATAAALTVTDGAGTNDGTIGAITADASVIAAVQELADQINKLVADQLDTKQLVNAVIDDLQAAGLVG